MAIQLKEITDIFSGYPFRGTILEKNGGNVSVIRVKDISPEDGLKADSVIKTILPSKQEPQFLRAGDILFLASGSSYYATLYEGQFHKAVAAPYFFIIRTKSPEIMPEFVVWQLNQASAQRYFAREAEGSFAKSIKRTALERVSLFLPDKQKQQAILLLYKNLSTQKRIYCKLSMNIEKCMHQIALSLEQDFNTLN